MKSKKPPDPDASRSSSPAIVAIAAAVFCSFGYWMVVVLFSRNIPYWDHLVFTEVIAGTKPFDWEFIWTRQAEHRLAVQKFLVVLMARLTNWNTVWENVLSSLCIFLGYLYFLRSRVFGVRSRGAATPWLLMVAATLLLINPVQHRNMLFAFQLAWGILFLCFIVFADIIPRVTKSTPALLLAALILILCAGLGMQGFAPLFYTIGYFVVSSSITRRIEWRLLFLCLLALFLMAACVFPIPNTGSSIDIYYDDPVGVLIFMLGTLGNPFSAQILACAVIHGIAAVGIVIYVFFRFRPEKSALAELRAIYMQHPLIIMAGMVLPMFLLGRFRFGVDYCLVSRYATFSILCNMGIVCYVFARIPSGHAVKKVCIAVLAVGLLTGYYSAWTFQTKFTRGIDKWVACVRRDQPPFDACNLDKLFTYAPDPNHAQRLIMLLYENKLSFFNDDWNR